MMRCWSATSRSKRASLPSAEGGGGSARRPSTVVPASLAAASSATAGMARGLRRHAYQLLRTSFLSGGTSGSRMAGRSRRAITSTVSPARLRAVSMARATRSSSGSGRRSGSSRGSGVTSPNRIRWVGIPPPAH